MAVDAAEVWAAHPSHRLDPKYHLFKREELEAAPEGWSRCRLSQVLRRRDEVVAPEKNPDKEVRVMTISQTGEIRPRAAGKGRNPPEWLGMYFEDSPSTWFQARTGDVVFSSIDLWKGCVSVVPPQMDRALVTKEFPIYEITDSNLNPEFLSVLLRSRYYQRAFRAITTGHSNRRRTQVDDFENLEIAFPTTRDEQHALIAEILKAQATQRGAASTLAHEMLRFSNIIDGRGDEVLPDVAEEAAPEEAEAD
jgi:type I restriction enzyme M protein